MNGNIFQNEMASQPARIARRTNKQTVISFFLLKIQNVNKQTNKRKMKWNQTIIGKKIQNTHINNIPMKMRKAEQHFIVIIIIKRQSRMFNSISVSFIHCLVVPIGYPKK